MLLLRIFKCQPRISHLTHFSHLLKNIIFGLEFFLHTHTYTHTLTQMVNTHTHIYTQIVYTCMHTNTFTQSESSKWFLLLFPRRLNLSFYADIGLTIQYNKNIFVSVRNFSSRVLFFLIFFAILYNNTYTSINTHIIMKDAEKKKTFFDSKRQKIETEFKELPTCEIYNLKWCNVYCGSFLKIKRLLWVSDIKGIRKRRWAKEEEAVDCLESQRRRLFFFFLRDDDVSRQEKSRRRGEN